MSEYAVCFPMMSTQELVDWAKACHPNVSIHAYDATYRKFTKHVGTQRDISLIYLVKDHHCYPIRDERLKAIATTANQGGTDNVWKYMSYMKWSRRHEHFIVLNDLGEEELHVSGQVIVLPEDVKIKPVVERYILCTNYFVEYLVQEQPDNLVSLDISKCYPSILIDKKTPIAVYTIHDVIESFTHRSQLNYYGEFYIDEYVIQRFGANIKTKPGFAAGV